MKRGLIIGDLHSGHFAGLTHPDYQMRSTAPYKKAAKWCRFEKESWKWYTKSVAAHGPYDFCIVNGDNIDGRGERSGSTELLTADRNQQCDMAIRALEEIDTAYYLFTYGTGYHTGNYEDFEDVVAEAFDAKIGAHEWLDVNGLIFDIKHHISASKLEHTRGTPIAREKVFNREWWANDEQPKGDIFIRHHVHRLHFGGGVEQGRVWMGVTGPAMQGMGSKYGARRCSAHVDYGFMVFEVSETGDWTWQPITAKFKSQQAHARKL